MMKALLKNPMFSITFRKITIPQDINQRLDHFVKAHSRLNWGQAQSLLKRRLVYVTKGGAPKTRIRDNAYRLKKDDEVHVVDSVELSDSIKFGEPGTKRNIDDRKYLQALMGHMAVHEADDFVVVNKPVGIYAQGTGVLKLNLPNIVSSYYQGIGRECKASVVHRLDRPVSGLMVLALNGRFSKYIGEQLKLKRVDKTYTAICDGLAEKLLGGSHATSIDCYMRFSESNQRAIVENGKETEGSRKTSTKARLARVFAKDAKTDRCRVFELANSDDRAALEAVLTGKQRDSCKFYSEVEYQLLTGKRHQLRAVSKYILGTPILFDFKYGYGSPSPRAVEHSVHKRLTDDSFVIADDEVLNKYLKGQYRDKEYIYLASSKLAFGAIDAADGEKEHAFTAPYNHHFAQFIKYFESSA